MIETTSHDQYLQSLGPKFLASIDPHVFPFYTEHDKGKIEPEKQVNFIDYRFLCLGIG